MFDAFYLPASHAGPFLEEGPPGARWRVPALGAADITRLAQSLRERRPGLLRRPVDHIIAAIDAAGARLADPGDPLRRTADDLLPAVTGQAPEMCRLVLDRMVTDWRRPALERLLEAELRNPAALDGFARVDGRLLHATAPPLGTHILAGNVPGIAVTSVVRALLVKSAVLARTPEREPVLVPLFARALESVDPDIAGCIVATRWPRNPDLDHAAIAAADIVLVYGGREALDEARRHAPPGTPVLDHGPRVSFGFVCREAIADTDVLADVARAIAEATALFDQQGCVSPQLVYVEEGALPPRDLAAAIADALADLSRRLPRGPVEPADAAAIHALRATVEFRAIAGRGGEVFATGDTAATVLFETDSTFAGTPLNRVLRVKPLTDLDALPDLLRPVATLLQTAGYAGPPTRIAALAPRLVEAGVTRLAPFRQMPFPPPFWHHDGRGPLAELVRWADLEEPDP